MTQKNTKSFIFMLLVLAAAAVAYFVVSNQIDNFASIADISPFSAGAIKSASVNATSLAASGANLNNNLDDLAKDSADITKWQTNSGAFVARIKLLIDQAQGIADKIDSKIKSLKQSGKDTTQLEKYLVTLKSQIAAAQDKYNQSQATTLPWQSIRQLVISARQSLAQAVVTINQISVALKKIEPPASTGNATTTAH